MVGLFIETLFILPFAFMYILVLTKNGQLFFSLDKPTMALCCNGTINHFSTFSFPMRQKTEINDDWNDAVSIAIHALCSCTYLWREPHGGKFNLFYIHLDSDNCFYI